MTGGKEPRDDDRRVDDKRHGGICHDRTIHTFDSQGNAIWVGDFSVYCL